MKTFAFLLVPLMLTVCATPGHCFFDYLFGGSATTDTIGNNVVGDLRAWWTGNPVYNFNPYYSGGNPQAQSNAPMQPGQSTSPTGSAAGPQYYPNQQPSVTYYPPQGQQYGYAQQGQPMPQQYQQVPQGYQMQQPAPQGYYQGPQQQYQNPQAYQGMPQGYEQAPQGYSQGTPGRFQNYQYEEDTPQQ